MGDYVKPVQTVPQHTPDGLVQFRREGENTDVLQIHADGTLRVPNMSGSFVVRTPRYIRNTYANAINGLDILLTDNNFSWSDVNWAGTPLARTADLVVPDCLPGDRVELAASFSATAPELSGINFRWATYVEGVQTNAQFAAALAVTANTSRWVSDRTVYTVKASDINFDGSVRFRLQYTANHNGGKINMLMSAGLFTELSAFGPIAPAPGSKQLIFDGQSMMQSPVNGVDAIPNKVAHSLSSAPAFAVTAWSGTTYAQREDAAYVDVLIPNAETTIIVDNGGQSDLDVSHGLGLTAAQLYTAMSDYHSNRKDAGASYIIVSTILPSHTVFNSGEDTERQDYNDLLRTDLPDSVDALVDLAAIVDLQDSTDTDYYCDGAHLTDAGTDLAYPPYVTAINSAGVF